MLELKIGMQMLKLIVKQICRKYIFWGKTSVADLEFLRDGPFDIQGGWDFLKKNSLFPYRSEKIQCLQ